MRKTAVYRDDLFLQHLPGFTHVESPERLQVIYQELAKEQVAAKLLTPAFGPAPLEAIALNHSQALIQRVADTAKRQYDFLDADTHTSPHSFAAATLAVGALLDGIKRIHAGEIDNAFCLVRPPGHHAEKNQSMGFCLFNNVAVAAQWAIAHLGLERILIVDWDLHHGNGTQESFYDTDKVLYISTHQYPYYPGTGSLLERGTGRGEGYTLNIPLTCGVGDLGFAQIFNKLVAPVARRYQPQLILVSCGFDIYKDDPLGEMRVTTAGFAYLTRVMVELAGQLCGGALLLTLEGGYNLTAMRDGSLAVLTELYGETLHSDYPQFLAEHAAAHLAAAEGPLAALEQALSLARIYWDI